MKLPGSVQVMYSPDEGGAAAAPSTAPTADSVAAPPSPDTSTPGVSEFDGLSLDYVDDLEDLEIPASQEASKETPTPPTQAAQPPAPEAPVPPVAPAAKPVTGQQETPQAGAQPPAPATPPSTPAEPMSLAQAMDANRDALIAQIATDMFAVSKEEADALELDVIGSLPRLQAKVFFQTIKAVHNLLQQQVPQIIEQHSSVNRAREETENAFYSQFKGLDKAKHHKDVVAFAKTFRAVNPQVTQDELWSMVSAAVAAKHGLTTTQAPQRTPARPPQQEPFVPARPGAVVRTTPEPDSPWGGMGLSFDEDEG